MFQLLFRLTPCRDCSHCDCMDQDQTDTSIHLESHLRVAQSDLESTESTWCVLFTLQCSPLPNTICVSQVAPKNNHDSRDLPPSMCSCMHGCDRLEAFTGQPEVSAAGFPEGKGSSAFLSMVRATQVCQPESGRVFPRYAPASRLYDSEEPGSGWENISKRTHPESEARRSEISCPQSCSFGISWVAPVEVRDALLAFVFKGFFCFVSWVWSQAAQVLLRESIQ